jgi:three-Cys-motif partner protein
MENVVGFFKNKRPWSKYKDLILDYYLKPYLNKVARLNKPIVVVDCFAGPGKFEDGENGSPLIISKHLQQLHSRGVNVLGFYIEADPVLYDRLIANTSELNFPVKTRFGSFRDHVAEITSCARTSTIFVYLDPIVPSSLLFNDLGSVYDELQKGQSVETLINFMSTSFLRAVCGLRRLAIRRKSEEVFSSRVDFWNRVAGGDYWQNIIFGPSTVGKHPTDELARGYAEQLKKWFDWTLVYAIREKYENKFPKYHLIFGSRSPDAVDLMNRAMVKARTEFVGARFVTPMLFPNQPAEEIVDPVEIKKIIIDTCSRIGKKPWFILRAHATVSHPCMYTDSQFDIAIKQAIQENAIFSTSKGNKVENFALIWPK